MENENLDLFAFLKYILGCTYISDLRTNPYNKKARLIISKLDLSRYPQSQINDIVKYIYF